MRRSLRSWLWRVPLDQEVDEELATHIELRTRELIERGLDPGTARDRVLSRIGDLGQLKRTCVDLGRKRDREMRITRWLDERKADVRFALRQLKASPAFTAVAVVTLALGVGANSAMFALADATLLRPLPYGQPDRLVMVSTRHPTVPRGAVSPIDLRDWEEQSRSFEALAAIASGLGGGPLVQGPDGSLQSGDRQMVTAGFFDVLGIAPVAGRTFGLSDADRGAPPVIVMGEGLWRRRFGADPSIVGRQLRLNGEPFTVVGIVRDDLQLQRPAQIWSLLTPPEPDSPRNFRFLQTIGRMKAGVTIDDAQADLEVIAARLAKEHPSTNKDWSVTVEPLRTGVMSPALQRTSLLLLGVVAFVLLLCCANVANLLLARGSVRVRELTMRAALGAGRARIVSQLLTESLVLAAVGGVCGAGVGAVILRVAPSLVPAGLLPAAATIAFDRRVAIFCALAAAGVGVLFGLVPAWQATKTSLLQAISSDSRSSTRRGGRLRHVLVAGEVAAAVVLLCGAGLLLRTLVVLDSFDPGYRADGDGILTMDFSLPAPREGTRYRNLQALMQFYDEASREVRAIPGVHSIGWSTGLPYGTTEIGRIPMEIVGDPPAGPGDRPLADLQAASPGYFETLDVPLVAGRSIDDRDTADSPMVCLVNEAFARRYLSGRDPLGIRIRTVALGTLAGAAERQIVGVVRQVKGRLDEPDARAVMYLPLAQLPWPDTYLVVQASTAPVQALLTPIREAIARIDRNVPVRRERTLTDLANGTISPHRFRAVIVGTFAALALVLAMVGIFGVLAHSVEQRRRELGVRMALGATAASVVRLILGGASLVVAMGAIVGLVAAAALSRMVSTFLFGVEPLDPLAFASSGLLLTLTAALAALAPAWRAARVNPATAVRED